MLVELYISLIGSPLLLLLNRHHTLLCGFMLEQKTSREHVAPYFPQLAVIAEG